MKALDKIVDYLIGTEGCGFYNKEMEWYSENIKDEKELEKKLVEISRDKADYLVLGKVLPDMIEIGAITYAAISKQFLWPCVAIGLAEGTRHKASKNLMFDKLDYAYKKHEYLFSPEKIEKMTGKLAEKLKENMSKEEIGKLKSEMGEIIKENKESLANHDCNKCVK
jgi:hypothetical protein